MTQILADAKMTKQIQEATGPVAVVNDQGNTIGYCMPIKFPHSPYSRDEIERRREEARKSPEKNKSFAEVMAHLNQLAGEKP